MWNTLQVRPTISQDWYLWRRPHPALSPPSSHFLRQDVGLSLPDRGTFSNSRAWSPFKATLTTLLPTRDVRKCDPHSNVLCRFSLSCQWYAMPTSDITGCFQEHISTCSIVMSVHMTYQYLSECGAVKYPRLVIKQRHEMCFYASIDCHLQWATAVVMLPVLSLIANTSWAATRGSLSKNP